MYNLSSNFLNITLFVSLVLIIVSVFLNVAFFILLERKIISYIQNRLGPAKVGFMGIIQSFADAIKLILKENNFLSFFKTIFYFLCPFISVILMIMCWFWWGFHKKKFFVEFSILFFVCISRLKVFVLLGSGWSSNSKFSLIGRLRGCIQVVSYEITLIFVILFPCCLYHSFKILKFYSISSNLIFIIPIIFIIWIIRCVAETNRAPFDFAEGERELVSGFKTEYGALPFLFLFLAEYGNIIFFCFLTSLLFLFKHFVKVIFFSLFFCFCFIWFRSRFPRLRIDFLMFLCWKRFLPLVIFYIILLCVC